MNKPFECHPIPRTYLSGIVSQRGLPFMLHGASEGGQAATLWFMWTWASDALGQEQARLRVLGTMYSRA